MKKLVVLFIALLFCCSSCQTLQNWLFDASDYSVFDNKKTEEEQVQEQADQDIFWDDADFDIWYDENEYD